MKYDGNQKQGGFVLAVVAAALVALVGFVAMAVDMGILYSARTSSQRVADAAALAGAFTFVVNPLAPQPQTAIDHATQVAMNNTVMGVPITAADVSVNVDVANRRVTVDVDTDQNTYFAQVFRPDDVNVGAEGIAEASAEATAAACTKPWFIPNTVIGDSDACANCEAGQVLISNGQLTPYAISKLGTQFVVKAGSPSDSISPGNFYPIQLPGSVGGNDYRQNIASCPPGIVGCADWYSVETGNMIGPTAQGVRDLIGSPPRDSFVNVGEYQLGSGQVSDTSAALIIAPIWDTCTMAGFCPAGDFPSGTQVSVQVIGFALLFLEDVQGNDVIARLINVMPCGLGGGGGGAPGGGGGETGSGVYSVPIRLVRVPN